MNLALLRVCAVIFIVYILGFITNMLLLVGYSGELASVWNAITTSSFEDLLGTLGLLVASGAIVPIALGTLAVVIALSLGIFALVKKNVTSLKILAVLMMVWVVAWPAFLSCLSGLQFSGGVAIGMIFNANLVAIVAAFFVAPKKRVDAKHDEAMREEESGTSVVRNGFNLGLYRFCAIYFLVSGIGGTAGMIVGRWSVLFVVLFNFVAVLAGIFALVKKKTDILTACALLMIVQVFWISFHALHMESTGFFMTAGAVLRSIFNTMTVVCVATFFIEPERTRMYFRKVKSLFKK